MYKYLFGLVVLLCLGCNKFTDILPPGAGQNPYTNDSTASGTVLGIYELAMKEQGLLNGHLPRLLGLGSDELDRLFPIKAEDEFLNDTLSPSNRFLSQLWAPGYACIAQCNNGLTELGRATHLSRPLQEYLQGEVHFLRSLSFFYLLHSFGGVPLITGTDAIVNAKLPRSPDSAVYQQIIADLQAAERLLPDTHPQADLAPYRRTRAERGAARTLLSRIFLYLGDYAAAEHYASRVIDAGSYRLVDSLPLVFLPNSEEAIFQLKPVSNGYNTAEASIFLLLAGDKPVYSLTGPMHRAFDARDQRLQYWFKRVDPPGQALFYQPYKYKVTGSGPPYREYNLVLRLAEVYLIRAEARARLGNLAGALADLGAVRQRAGLSLPDTLLTKKQVLLAVARERQTELAVEWGHRFFDLKRWYLLNNPSDVLFQYAHKALTGRGNWRPSKLKLPIPAIEFLKNLSLVQNPND